MAWFMYWPSQQMIISGVLEVADGHAAKLTKKVAAGWLDDGTGKRDKEVKLFDTSGKEKAGAVAYDGPAVGRMQPLTVSGLADGDVLRILDSRSADWAPPLRVQVYKTGPYTKSAARQQIAAEATKHYDTAHYLWGTAGNVPGGAAGHVSGKQNAAKLITPTSGYPDLKLKTVAELLNPLAPYVRAAFSVTAGSQPVSVCAGRCDRDVEFDDIVPTDLAYLAYLGKLTAECVAPGWKGVASWSPDTDGKTPRKMRFKTDRQRLVWGDPCDGVMHFDCVGLVNHAVGFVWHTGAGVCLEIEQWMDDAWKRDKFGKVLEPRAKMPKGYFGTTSVAGKPPMAGDLVGKQYPFGDWHHIGIIYLDSGRAMVMQASETRVGMAKQAFVPAEWQGHTRLLDSSLASV